LVPAGTRTITLRSLVGRASCKLIWRPQPDAKGIARVITLEQALTLARESLDEGKACGFAPLRCAVCVTEADIGG
jgi:hypothetical protein